MLNAKPVDSIQDADQAFDKLTAEAGTGKFWAMAKQVLHMRAGWTLNRDDNNNHAMFFGWEGQGLLVVTTSTDGLKCFHWREDTDELVTSARDLWCWVKDREDSEDQAGADFLVEFRKEVRDAANERLDASLPT